MKSERLEIVQAYAENWHSKSMEGYPGRKISPNMSRDHKTGVITVYIYRLGVVQQVLSDKSHPGWVSDRGERLGVRGGGWGRSTSLRAVISKFTLKLR